MGKNKNKMRNITVQGNPNSDSAIQSETKTLIKATVQQIDASALAEASLEYMGELLRSILETPWGPSSTPGTDEAIRLIPGIMELTNAFEPGDEAYELMHKMAVGYRLINAQAVINSTLTSPDLQPENRRFEFIKDTMSKGFVDNLDNAKVRFCSMKSSMLTAEEAEAQQVATDVTTTPAATPVNAKPSATNAVAVATGKTTCPRCQVEVDSKSVRKVILNDKVTPDEAHAQFSGKMVCQSCLNEIQAGHAETIKAAKAEAEATITQLKDEIKKLETALTIVDKADSKKYEDKLNVKKQQLANFEIAVAALNK